MAVSGVTGRRAVRGLLVGVALYYALWGGEYSAFDLARLGREQDSQAEALAVAQTDADSLRVLAKRLESDPAAIERAAREKFGMIRSGETLYRFVNIDPLPEDPTGPASAP